MGEGVDLLQLPDCHLGVDAGGFKPGVAEELLDVSDIRPVFEHKGCASVPDEVATAFAADVGGFHPRNTDITQCFTCFAKTRLLPLIPRPQPRPAQVNPVRQHRQRFRGQSHFRHASFHVTRPSKRPALQPLDQHPEPAPIPIYDLEPTVTAIGKNEQRPLAQVFLKPLAHQRLKPIETLAQVHRLQRDVNLQAAGKTQHPLLMRSAIKATNSAAICICTGDSITSPLPPGNSIRKPTEPLPLGARSATAPLGP